MELLNITFLIFLLLSPEPPSAVAAASYFIDCGSSGTTTDNNQDFAGDSTLPAGVKLSAKNSKSIKDHSNSNQSLSSLYKTARIFHSPASYRFNTPDSGTFLLRLHFFAFNGDLTSAHFNISANHHMLLPSFTAMESLSSSIIREFLLPVKTGESLKIYFTPNAPSNLAFVNAIEVIPAPLNLTNANMANPGSTLKGTFGNLGSRVLRPIFRLNVGGSNLGPSGDLLRRTWCKDDPHLVLGKGYALPKGPATIINQKGMNGTDTEAPLMVYKTARGWNLGSNFTGLLNATWRFSVNKSSNYFVRVHLCDIVSQVNGDIVFNLFFFENFMLQIDAFNLTGENAAPFCLDFVVKSDELGFINLTMGSTKYSVKTGIDRGAFLNGLEIMEFVTGTATEPKITSKSWNILVILVFAAVGLSLIFILAVGALWFSLHKRKKTSSVDEFFWPLPELNEGRRSSRSKSLQNLHLRIPLAVIQEVTNSFDESLMIGRGGFGRVYKGVLKNGQRVAVKRSVGSTHGQGLPEFQTEITVLSKIRHRHLVSLIGYCDEDGEMILVYEFMENGTLRDHLYGDLRITGFLTWKQRLEICIGAAKGLNYLHSGSTAGIIHRDVKSTNILLDENCVAKVADFGLSRIGVLEESHVSTAVKGTFGYVDPEYCQCMQLTEKSDVYSFGVLLLEVLSARLALDTSLPAEQVSLADWAMSCQERGELDLIVDAELAGRVDDDSVRKYVETAARCLRASGGDRPPMSDVLWDLEYALRLHVFGGRGVGFGGDTSVADVSFDLPMLAVDGDVGGDVSGLRGDDGDVSIGRLRRGGSS